MKLVPTFFMLLGSFCSIFYHYKYNVKIYFYNIFFKSLRNFSFVYGFFNQKWFFDFLYNSFVVNFFLFFGYHVLYVKIDKGILEIVGPYGFYNFFLVLYDKLYGLQVNNIIMYLFYVFVIFSIFFVFFFSIFTITFDFVFVIGAFLLLYER